MWPLAGREIRAAIAGEGGEGADDDLFTGVAVRDGWAEHDVLFAIDLNHTDGHAHVEAFLASGGKLAVVSNGPAGTRRVRVNDVLAAFKRLAGFMRSRIRCPVIAVVGANGKTTTKDMTRAVLSGGGRRVVATRGTENGHYGVPFTLLDRALDASAPPDAVVVEIGIDEVGAMHAHADLVRADLAIVTSLGEEHLRGLKDAETAAREELEILSTGARRVVPVACTVGEFDGASRVVSFEADGIGGQLRVPMPGEVHARLAALAVGAALALGRGVRDIEQGFAAFVPPKGRAEVARLGRDVVLVDDSFNASPPSVRAALELLSLDVWANRPKAVVLGDMLDLGEASDRAHEALVPQLRALRGVHLRLYGDAMARVHRALAHDDAFVSLVHVPTSADPLLLLDGVWASLEGAVVLVKGSRGMRLERVAGALRRAYATARPLPPRPRFGSDFLTIGVTGTNGKSSTTTWAAAMLAHEHAHVARATTLGYFLDDQRLDYPLDFDGFVAALREAHARGARACALEVTSEALQHGFGKVWPFRIGVFTNLTHDHLDVHTSPEHYLASKAQLFMNLSPGGTAVLNACDPASELLREVVPEGVAVVGYGVASRGAPVLPAEIFARTSIEGRGTRVLFDEAPTGFPPSVFVPVVGDVFVENALAAALAARAAGISTAHIIQSLETLALPPGRFEVITERPWVVVDYAHTPDALARVITAARGMTRGRVILVFGAGGDRDARKRYPMGRAAASADVVWVTNDNPRTEDPLAIARDLTDAIGVHPAVVVELDRARAIEGAVRSASRDDVVLVCGKGHETEQIIGTARLPFSDREVALSACRASSP